jgi:hypothetical protein
MYTIYNPFKTHPIENCCSKDDLRPFLSYIYFNEGIAYATDAHCMVAVSLSTIGADFTFIQFLNGYKIHYQQMTLLNKYDFIYYDEPGIISLNDDKTIVLKLSLIQEDDKSSNFETILQTFQNAKKQISTQSNSVNSIDINLELLAKVSKSIGSLNSAKFYFAMNNSVFLEFIHHTDTFAIIMALASTPSKLE